MHPTSVTSNISGVLSSIPRLLPLVVDRKPTVNSYFPIKLVRNRGFMVARDAGCARCAGCAHTTRPYWHAYALVNGVQAVKIVFTPCLFLFVFPSVLSLPFSFHLTSSSSLSFLQLNTINYDPHPRKIQKLCLYLSRSTPLRKALTVNRYLRIEYFQQN